MISRHSSLLGLKDLSATNSGTISSGADESISIQPPKGQIYKLTNIGFYVASVAAGGDGGTHELVLGRGTASGWDSRQFYYKSTYDSAIQIYLNNIAAVVSTTQIPSNDSEQLHILDNAYATYDTPLTLIYANDATTATQSNSRYYRIYALIYKEAV